MATVTDTAPVLQRTEGGERIHRVLFVCTGNTCRSPMAAAAYNHKHRKTTRRAYSAGLAAVAGDPISQNAVLALQAAGIPSTPDNDYMGHTATPVTLDLLREMDEIVAISPSHAMALLTAAPQYAERIRVLGDIADPYGGDLAAYSATLAEILSALEGENAN